MLKLKLIILFLGVSFLGACTGSKESVQPNEPDIVHLVFVSDSHYGLNRVYNGQVRSAEYVNGEMLRTINSLSGSNLPNDNGVGEGSSIGAIEMIVHGGDISNRQETGIQSATESWKQFNESFINKISTLTTSGKKTELYVLPGNHDVSNAIGYYKSMDPLTDASCMAGIYNLMFNPVTSKTKDNYNYDTDKVNLAVDRFGIRFLFVNMWPGANERKWMSDKLGEISSATPAIIFTHDPPAIEAKHLTNPESPHTINGLDKYENLISDMPVRSGSTLAEQRDFCSFLAQHPNIKTYFHGHTNYNEFYVYTGPDDNIRLHTFRVDSPLKGQLSADDQSKLSFLVVSINRATKQMTVRECFWARNTSIEWGQTKTIRLTVTE